MAILPECIRQLTRLPVRSGTLLRILREKISCRETGGSRLWMGALVVKSRNRDSWASDPSPATQRILVCTFAFNEGAKLNRTVTRILEAVPYDVLVVDDGSTDGSVSLLRQLPIRI